MIAAFIGIFAMFLGFIMMVNASPPDGPELGFWVFICGAVLTGAAFVDMIAKAVF